METTTPKGLRQDEYNALLHAIWRLKRVIKDAEEFHVPTSPETMRKLSRDLQALENLFVRIA